MPREVKPSTDISDNRCVRYDEKYRRQVLRLDASVDAPAGILEVDRARFEGLEHGG